MSENAQSESGQKVARAIQRLNGDWEYKSEVQQGEYPDQKPIRGGRMHISSRKGVIGLSFDISGQQEWRGLPGEDETRDRYEILPNEIPWSADGGFAYGGGQLNMMYTSSDREVGWRTESFPIPSGEKLPLENEGTFEDISEEGRLMTGKVSIRKMKHPEDYHWGPRGLKA